MTAAVVQLTSTADVHSNLQRAEALTLQAAELGARFIALPENFAFIGGDIDRLKIRDTVDGGLLTNGLRRIAQRFGVWILAGSIPERTPDPRLVYNTSVLIGSQGETVAVYRKIHLFDVELGDEARFCESDNVMPGDEVVVGMVAGINVGLSVCYDVRFPELYRALIDEGAQVLCVPSAFTLHTGKDHWEILLRARAIENQCYVIAPAQFGRHDDKRVSWGKSMIIDPWGTPLCTVPEREGIALATLDWDTQERLRRELPCLDHRCLGVSGESI